MYKKLVSVIVLAMLASCSVKTSSSPVTGAPTGSEEPQSDGSNPTSPNDPLASPFNFAAKVTENGFSKNLPLVEVLQLQDRNGKKRIEIRLFSSPPVTMCNVSTLSDSYSYQNPFTFLRVSMNEEVGQQTITTSEFGTRGLNGYSQIYNKGTVTLTRSANGRYTGWLNVKAQGGQIIQGNFEAIHCEQTKSLLKGLNIMGTSQKLTLHAQNGETFETFLDVTVDEDQTHFYEDYMENASRVKIQIWQSGSSLLSFWAAGNSAGKYIGLGNASCASNSSGTAIGEFIDNDTLVLNQRDKRPYFCQSYDSAESEKNGSMIIKINRSTGIRTIELTTANRIYSGTL